MKFLNGSTLVQWTTDLFYLDIQANRYTYFIYRYIMNQNVAQTSEDPRPMRRFLRVKWIPATGVSLVLKLAMMYWEMSVLTLGLCVTLTSSRLQSEVNLL